MKMVRTASAVIALGWLTSIVRAEARAGDTPISKVLELLKGMAQKGTADKNAEATRFTAFYQWCGDQTRIKNNEIATGKETIEMTKAEIEKAAALIKSLSSRIMELEEDVGRWKKDQSSASDVRAKEATDYRATADDYTETLTALDDAIVTLKKQAFNRPQAELIQKSLLQVSRKNPVLQKALSAFLQQPSVEEMPDDQLFNKAPEAHGYEFQSGGVIDMLEKLKDQFGSKKYELDKEELTAQHAHEQIMQQLTDNIENAEHEISRKTTARGETQQAKADSEGVLAETIADLKEDSTYLDDMTAMCATKKADFERRDKMRADEIAAIKEAVEIISSKAVAGAGDSHLPALVQIWQHRGVSLVQVRNNNANDQSPLQGRISTFLADRAKKLDSHLLAMISQRVSVDPFNKVKKLVKDLIWKLMEEATAETEHKGWCDTELSTNKQTRDAKSEEVSKLAAQAEQLTSEIAELGQDIQDLTSAIAELSAAMATATQDRSTAKATNEATIKDAQEAQAAVGNAIAVLKDYYAKSAQATSLVQQGAGQGHQKTSGGKKRQAPAEDAPETFDAPYKGMLPEGGNVADFLEVILTDFARLESETTTAEATEVEEHKKYMFASEKDKALKENSKGHKEAKKSDKESELHSTEEELRATREQLDAAAAYYEKLKPTCVDSGITYDERVKRRDEEIQSLKEALQILSGTAIDLP